jgi:hypothetical protein
MGPWPSSLVVVNDWIIPAQCEGEMMVLLENPLRINHDLVELNPEAHAPEGLYIASTLIRDRQKVAVCVLNVNPRDENLRKYPPGTL